MSAARLQLRHGHVLCAGRQAKAVLVELDHEVIQRTLGAVVELQLVHCMPHSSQSAKDTSEGQRQPALTTAVALDNNRKEGLSDQRAMNVTSCHLGVKTGWTCTAMHGHLHASSQGLRT